MGWLDTLLNWLLALLEWVCWPCHLIEWLGSLNQEAAATVFVGALNAAAILGAAILAIQKADSVLRERAQTRRFDSAEEILTSTNDAFQKIVQIIQANQSFRHSDVDISEELAREILHRAKQEIDDAEIPLQKLDNKINLAEIYHDNSEKDISQRIRGILISFHELKGAAYSLEAALEGNIDFPENLQEKERIRIRLHFIRSASRILIDINNSRVSDLTDMKDFILSKLRPMIRPKEN